MDAAQAVRRLKSDLASDCYTGQASRRRGIIVSSEIWKTLAEEEGFHGLIGVSGIEGSRFIRYSFYVLENPNFPQQSSDGYFFVGYPKEVYEERYLGREAEILSSQERRSQQYRWVTFTERNPITGVVSVEHPASGRYYYDVDYDEMIAVAEQSVADGEDPTTHIDRTFAAERRVSNPPEWKVILDPRRYDYDRAALFSSVGSMFMQRVLLANGTAYQVVGIGRNGLGKVVDVVHTDSRKSDPLEFARFALHFFLPEEIEEFLSRDGVTLPSNWKEEVDFHEQWGQWHDREELGRLNEHRWLGGSSDQPRRDLSGTFLSTRAKPYVFGFNEAEVGNWDEFLAQHFPSDWQGWPETAYDRSLAAFAAIL